MASTRSKSLPSSAPKPSSKLRVAVLVSGSGTNLQAILDRAHGRDGVEVVGVVSSKPGVKALGRAESAGIETVVFEASGYSDRVARDREMAAWLEERGVQLVVLAGFMELLTPAFLETFPNHIINVHPALLPAFPGAHPVEDQVTYGVKVSGVTVHFVDEGVDSGPIILQEPVRIPDGAGKDGALELLHGVEHELLPRAIRLIALGAVSFDRDNPRIVHVDERVLEGGE
jgi:phosphoribosylglycinamide formyltransferase-1